MLLAQVDTKQSKSQEGEKNKFYSVLKEKLSNSSMRV